MDKPLSSGVLRGFSLRRRIPGVRPLVLTAFSLVGTVLTFSAALGAAALVGALGGWLGIVPLGVIGGVIALVAAFGYACHLVGVGLERLWRLRSPWGRMAVGTDGVRWDGWWRRHFTAWRSIRGTQLVGDGVRVVLDDDSAFDLHPAERSAAIEALRAGMVAFQASEPANVPGELAPDRDPDAWLARVRGLRVDDYRKSGASSHQLVRVALDASAPPLARVGAALALGPEAQREREAIRAALAEIADEELAEGLEGALTERLDRRAITSLARRSG